MDSRQSLSGAELYALYLEDQTDPQLCDPDNLKSLLNYALNEIEEQMDSNLELEIVDFCVARLEGKNTMNEEKIAYFREKYNLVEKEQAHQRKVRRWTRAAATAAIFVVMVGAGLFVGGTNESQAGIVQWIIDLFVEDKNEQLSINTGTVYSKDIEAKEGHLPEKMPDGFVYDEQTFTESALEDTYTYLFKDMHNTTLIISIKDFFYSDACNNYELEIRKNSSKQKNDDNFTYYYTQNESTNYISWIHNDKMYTIRGEFDFSLLEEICSYYKWE